MSCAMTAHVNKYTKHNNHQYHLNHQSLNINLISEDWMDIARRKPITLEDIIPGLENKSQIFNFILDNWNDHLSNLTIPNWYSIFLLEANTNEIAFDCSNSYSSDPIETTITFEWKQYTQFFPIFQNFNITNTQTWIDDITNLPYEIIWNNDYINVTSLYY
eukprot:244698_1